MTKKTYYDVLQVSPSADPEVIKAAYRSLAQRFHPDKNPGNPDAEQNLKIINRAYEVLSDPAKRVSYDAALKEEDQNSSTANTSRPTKDAGNNKNNSSGANGERTQTTQKSEKNGPEPRPWIRFWARNIDYLVVGAIISYVIFHFGQEGTISEETLLWLENPFVYSTLIIGGWAILEPVVLAQYGTTIGKSALRVRLSHKHYKQRHHMDVWQLYQRSMNVWLRGLGIGLPFVSLITQLVSYRNLKAHGETSWDRDGGYTVTHGQVGYVRGSFTTIFILFALILIAMLNGHEERPAAPQSQQPVTIPLDQFIPDEHESSPQVQRHATPSDPFAELAALMKGAEEGNAHAQWRLGLMYGSGNGVPKDTSMARYWNSKAVEQGYAAAQHEEGLKYFQGKDAQQDYSLAASWFRKAAEQGEFHSQSQLGSMYLNGQGLPQDFLSAASWFRQAANQGDAGSQASLGMMYREGLGVPKDIIQAYMWLNLAASSGDPNLSREQKALMMEEREATQARMSDLQIEQAQALTRDWIGNHKQWWEGFSFPTQ